MQNTQIKPFPRKSLSFKLKCYVSIVRLFISITVMSIKELISNQIYISYTSEKSDRSSAKVGNLYNLRLGEFVYRFNFKFIQSYH